MSDAEEQAQQHQIVVDAKAALRSAMVNVHTAARRAVMQHLAAAIGEADARDTLDAYEAAIRAGAQPRTIELESALRRIYARAERILHGQIQTSAIGAADYNAQVARLVLGWPATIILDDTDDDGGPPEFVLRIKIEGAAFGDDGATRRVEIARILLEAERLVTALNRESAMLYDTDGNMVGDYRTVIGA